MIDHRRLAGEAPGPIAVAAQDEVALVVLDLGSVFFVQQPVFNRATFAWRAPSGLDPPADYVVRAYDTNGVQLDCLAFGTRAC